MRMSSRLQQSIIEAVVILPNCWCTITPCTFGGSYAIGESGTTWLVGKKRLHAYLLASGRYALLRLTFGRPSHGLKTESRKIVNTYDCLSVKLTLQHWIALLRWQRGVFTFDDCFTPPYNCSYVLRLVLFVTKWFSKLQLWISWIHSKWLSFKFDLWMRWIHLRFKRSCQCLDNPVVFNSTTSDGRGPIAGRFDSDSVRIGIDNHATRSLSPNMHHFEDLQLKHVGKCRGLSDQQGDGATIAGIGTLVFTIQDDDGKWHVIKLPNSLYLLVVAGRYTYPRRRV